MLRNSTLVLVAIICCAGCGQHAARAPDETGNPDGFFLVQASLVNHAAIGSSRLAHERAHSAEVKGFAELIGQDHHTADVELETLARRKGVDIGRRPDEAQLLENAHLAGLRGERFDREYMGLMVADQAKAVAMFANRAAQATDPDIQAWAARRASQVKHHLRLADQLNRALGGAPIAMHASP